MPQNPHWQQVNFSQHWVRWWLGAIRPPSITWASVDPVLCRHVPCGVTRPQWVKLACFMVHVYMYLLVWRYNMYNVATSSSDWLESLKWNRAGVRRYFDPHNILTPGSKYRNDILTPLTIFWPPYNNQWKTYIFLLYLLNKVCYYINIILINSQQW